MSSRVQIPYTYTVTEEALIAQNFKNHTDWSKDAFDTIKVNIISHLRLQQNNLCAYCKYQLGFDIKQVDIEHIIPKSEYEIFTFHTQNLVLSCPACNTKKSTKPVLNKKIVKYPTDGTSFIIIHGHFDEYSDHIDIINNCVFVAKSSKGSETITFCELFRLSTVEQRAKAFKKLSPNVLEQLVVELKNADPKDKNELIDLLKDTIR